MTTENASFAQPAAAPLANPDYYPIAEKAVAILDVLLTQGGVVEVDKRSRALNSINWTGLPNLPKTQLGAGDSVEFTFAVPEGSAGLFTVQLRDWPNGYIPPTIVVLGKLDPMSGNGKELDSTHVPMTYKTSEASCEFTGTDKLTVKLYRFKKDAAGRVTRDPNPGFVTTLDLATLQDGGLPGRAHVVLRLPKNVKGSLKFTKGKVGNETDWSF